MLVSLGLAVPHPDNFCGPYAGSLTLLSPGDLPKPTYLTLLAYSKQPEPSHLPAKAKNQECSRQNKTGLGAELQVRFP